MEKFENNIDSEIRKSFEENQVEVPSKLWNAISEKIKTDQPSFFHLYFSKNYIFGIIAGIGLATGGYFYFTQNNESVKFENKPNEIIVNDSKIENKFNNSALEEKFPKSETATNTNTSKELNNNSSDINNSNVNISSKGTGAEKFSLGLINLGIEKINNKYTIQGLEDTTGFRILQGPKNGSVVFDRASKKFIYQPKKGFVGKDDFKYQILDENGEVLNEGTIRINVDKELSSRADYSIEFLSANEINFINKSFIHAKDSSDFSFIWNFDNKEYSYNINEHKVYTDIGEYSVCLILKAKNSIDTFCKNISIQSKLQDTAIEEDFQSLSMKTDGRLEINPKLKSAGLISAERAQKKKDITTETKSPYLDNEYLNQESKKKSLRI